MAGSDSLCRRRWAAAVACTALAIVCVALTSAAGGSEGGGGGGRGPVTLMAAAISRLQAKLELAQTQEQAFRTLQQTEQQAATKYAHAKVKHDAERANLAQQLHMLDRVRESANTMAVAQGKGHLASFNRAMGGLNTGMGELKTLLAHAQCPPSGGGQAALNLCLVGQQLRRASALAHGEITPQGLTALQKAADGTKLTLEQLNRSDVRLKQAVAAAQSNLQMHKAWGGAVLKEKGDFARLAATFLPGKESRDLTQTWPAKPAAALSLLSNWMHRHDSWGLSSLAEIMKPHPPSTFDPTAA